MSSAPTSRTAGCPVAHPSRTSRPRPRRRPVTGVPSYQPDIYAPAAVLDPYPHYAALRDLGPVVWLEAQRMYALPRHAEVRAALLDDAAFRSADGVPLNPVARRVGRGSTLLSDGAVHDRKRAMLAQRLTPRALRPMRPDVESLADETVRAAVARGDVDGVSDLALALPLQIVPDFIGWPRRGRENLVRWAGATFDSLGPMNRQTLRTTPAAIAMLAFVQSLARRRDVLPGSLGADMVQRIEAGELRTADCRQMFIDYLAPSIDTTAGAIASALWLFARHPDQWSLLKERPDLVPSAINEVVRLESPLRAFGRLLAVDTTIGELTLPAGSRVLMMYASANRDERVFEDPDTFDITRDTHQQLGFGLGAHGCAGQGLARMESGAILQSLIARVDRIELTGTPEFAANNVIHRLERLPLRLTPTPDSDTPEDNR